MPRLVLSAQTTFRGTASLPRAGRLLHACRIALILAGLLASCGESRAAWQSFAAIDGLPNTNVEGFYQDRRSQMWFLSGRLIYINGSNRPGTIARFDGLNWASWQLPPQSLGVPVIAEDSTGALWCALGGNGEPPRLGQFDGNAWVFTSPGALGNPHYSFARGFARDFAGRWLVAFDYGLFAIVSKESVEVEALTMPPGFGSIGAITADSSGGVWVTDGSACSGVARLTQSGWSTVRASSGLGNDCADALLCDRQGAVWVAAASGGLARFRDGVWTSFGTEQGLSDNRVDALAQDARGGVWCTSGQGLSRYDGRSWTNYDVSDAFPEIFPQTLFGDDLGNLWCGGGPDVYGVWRFDGVHRRTIEPPQGLFLRRPCVEDTSGAIWFTSASGVCRHDGSNWSSYDLPLAQSDRALIPMHVSRNGDLWAAADSGAARFDGGMWRFPPEEIRSAMGGTAGISEETNGRLWFSTIERGIWSFDGFRWLSYQMDQGLLSNKPSAPLADPNGRIWFGYRDVSSAITVLDSRGAPPMSFTGGSVPSGFTRSVSRGSGDTIWARSDDQVGRFDGAWRSWVFDRGGRGGSLPVSSLVVDSSGTAFVGGYEVIDFPEWSSVFRFDGSLWTEFHYLGSGELPCVCDGLSLDRDGGVWLAECLARYESGSWELQSTSDRETESLRAPLLEDSRGRMWFATNSGKAATYDRDRTAPQTVIFSGPPELSPLRNISFSFIAGYAESGAIEFSHRLDDGDWQPWTAVTSWSSSVADGQHVFAVKARDRSQNGDPSPATFAFVIDTQPPVPRIDAPASRAVVRDTLIVVGAAEDPRFVSFAVDMKPAGGSSWDGVDVLRIGASARPISPGELARYDTRILKDGEYDVRLTVRDELDLVGTALLRIIIDNEAPAADRTSPVEVNSNEGGDVYTTQGEVHLYLQPGSLARSAAVTLSLLDPDSMAAALPNALRLVGPAVRIEWGSQPTAKSSLIDFAFRELASDPQTRTQARLRRLETDGTWSLVGGTVDPSLQRLSCPLVPGSTGGVFALVVGDGHDADLPVSGTGLTFAPRAFVRSGPEARDRVAIAFSLPQSGPATVRVFNRAGRLVRLVAQSVEYGAGVNVALWDGRSDEGVAVNDGLYVVTVEAGSVRMIGTLAVLR